MGNMSYCKFRNTLKDAQDCIDTMNNRETLSEDEMEAAKNLVEAFGTFLEENNLVTLTSDHDEMFTELFDNMKEGNDEEENDECPECNLPEDECEC